MCVDVHAAVPTCADAGPYMRKNVSMAPCPGMSKNVNTEEENKILTGHATGMSCKHSVSSDAAIILNNNVMQKQICTAHTYPVPCLDAIARLLVTH